MSNLKCTVCSQPFKKNDEIKVTSCSHMFHGHCFDSYFRALKQCPKCDEILSASDIYSMTFGSTRGSGQSTTKNDDKQTEILKLLKKIKLESSKQSQSDSDSSDGFYSPKHGRKSHCRRRRDSSDSEDDDYSQGHGPRNREVAEYRGAEIVNRNGTVIKCNEFKPVTVNVCFDTGLLGLFGGGGNRK